MYISDSTGLKGKKITVFFGETVALPLFMSRAFNHDFYGDCNIRLLSVGSALKQRGREKREACRHNSSRMSFSQLRALSHFNTSLWLPLKERIYNMCADKMLPSCCFFSIFMLKKGNFITSTKPRSGSNDSEGTECYRGKYEAVWWEKDRGTKEKEDKGRLYLHHSEENPST